MRGHAVVPAIGPGAWAHAPAVLPGPGLAGAGLVAAATVAWAWLARRRPGHREIWFAAAAGALLIIAGLHLLPDAWSGARTARIWACPALLLPCWGCSPAIFCPPRGRPSVGFRRTIRVSRSQGGGAK
jgi:hypothetical protein